jgi:O-antigen ligase
MTALPSIQADRNTLGSYWAGPGWLPGSIAVVANFAALTLGPLANQFALLLTVAVILYACTNASVAITPLLVVSATMCVWWAVLLLNPNVIDISHSLVGYRGSVTVFFGAILGTLWLKGRLQALQLLWACVLIGCVASLMLFYFFPEAEAGIQRSAGEFTAEFMGERRLQGIFAGPFHVSIAGAFLVLSSISGGLVIPSRVIRCTGLVVGLIVVYLAQVRTGFVAIGVGLLLLLLLSEKRTRWMGRHLYVPAGVLACAILGWPWLNRWFSGVPALDSLRNVTGDSRFLHRADTWREAIGMIRESPLIGWGPGSAGATLERYFPPGGHITSHNLVLKYGVEGGLLGLFLIVAFLLLVGFGLVRNGDKTRFGVCAFVPILIFGTVGSTLDTLPVSFALVTILGICVAAPYANNPPELRPRDPMISRTRVGGTDEPA